MERPAILVAEPNHMQRQMIDLLLAAEDFDVTLAETSEAALAYLREHTPAAALLAVELPDIDGFRLCQKLKVVGRLSSVPVVLLAQPAEGGGLDESTRARARAVGADLLLQRPLGDKNLRERVLRLIRRPTGSRAPEPDPAGVGVAPAPEEDDGLGYVGAALGAQAASELGRLRAEVAQLRGENASLQARLTKTKELAKNLQAQLDAERQRPKGLFGRRS
jgi:DNA-binding response OmpR family regulator